MTPELFHNTWGRVVVIITLVNTSKGHETCSIIRYALFDANL